MKKKSSYLLSLSLLTALTPTVFSCGAVPFNNQTKIIIIGEDSNKLENSDFSIPSINFGAQFLAKNLMEIFTYTNEKYTNKDREKSFKKFVGEDILNNYSFEGINEKMKGNADWKSFYSNYMGVDNVNGYFSDFTYELGNNSKLTEDKDSLNYFSYNTDDPQPNAFKMFNFAKTDKKDSDPIVPVNGPSSSYSEASKDDSNLKSIEKVLKTTKIFGTLPKSVDKFNIKSYDGTISSYDILKNEEINLYLDNKNQTGFVDSIVYFQHINNLKISLTYKNSGHSYKLSINLNGMTEKLKLVKSTKYAYLVPVSYSFDGDKAFDNTENVMKNLKVKIDSITKS